MDERSEFFASQETLVACYRRIGVISLIALFVFCALGFRLWQLQIVEGARFRTLSEKNRLRLKRLPSIRGRILDRTGRVVVENRPSFDVVLVPEDAKDRLTTLRTLVSYLPETAGLLEGKLPRNPHRSPYEGIFVARDVSWDTLVAIEAHQLDLPGVTVEVSAKRSYVGGPSASHLLGYVGEVNSAEIARHKGYRLGDLVGKVGLEKVWEEVLRGYNGGQQIEVDATGRKLRILDEVKTRPGHNLRLTLDFALQEQVERALGHAEGAVVVLAVETGEVLALANRPAFNPNLFARGIKPNEWRALVENPLRPLTNRVLRGQYPPGSIFKPIMALAALEEGIITPETQFGCQGSLSFGGRTFHCWKRSGHGRLDLKQALAQSCDVYFYQIGQRLGIQKIAQAARRFWLGQDLGLALGSSPGLIPDVEWKRRRFNAPWYAGETLSVVIGQSYVVTTPLQIAVATAAIANGGVVYRPLFVKHVLDVDGEPIQTYAPEIITRVNISEEHLRIVRDGMREVVHGELGTGKKALLPHIEVAGKTGTAQVVSGLSEKEEEVPRRHRDHAWFVAFAPATDPEIVVVCLLEHAGEGGGAVAAPVVRQVLEAYFHIAEQRKLDHDGIRQTAGRAF